MFKLCFVSLACVATITGAQDPSRFPKSRDGISFITTLQFATAYAANLTFEAESINAKNSRATTASIIEKVKILTDDNPGAGPGFLVQGPTSEALQVGGLTTWWDCVYSATSAFSAIAAKAEYFDGPQRAQLRAWAKTVFEYVSPAINNATRDYEPQIAEGIRTISAFLDTRAKELIETFSP